MKCPNCGHRFEQPHAERKMRAPSSEAVARWRKEIEQALRQVPVARRIATEQDLQLWAQAAAENEEDLPKVVRPESMNEGIALSWRNAQQFVRDAEVLHANGSFGHSLALSLFAIEEAGKMVELKIRKDCRDAIGSRLYRHIFRKHGFKIAVAVWRALTTKAIEDFKTTKSYDEFETSSALSALMIYQATRFQRLREAGLYVDFDSRDDKWLSPFSRPIEDQAQTWLKFGQSVVSYIGKTWNP